MNANTTRTAIRFASALCHDRQTVQGLRIHRNTNPRAYEQGDRCLEIFHTSTPMSAYCELPGCPLEGKRAELGIERFCELANEYHAEIERIKAGNASDRCGS